MQVSCTMCNVFIEVPVKIQESEPSCICVLRVSMSPLSTILRLDLGIVPTMWYIFSFYCINNESHKIRRLFIFYSILFSHISLTQRHGHYSMFDVILRNIRLCNKLQKLYKTIYQIKHNVTVIYIHVCSYYRFRMKGYIYITNCWYNGVVFSYTCYDYDAP